MSAKRRLTPYQRIVRAAKGGRSLRLTWEDVQYLSMDDAISRRADNDDEEATEPSGETPKEGKSDAD